MTRYGLTTGGLVTTNSYAVGDLINHLSQNNLNVYKFAALNAKYASIPYLLFTPTEFDAAADGTTRKILTFKNIPMFHTVSESGNSVKWGEYSQLMPVLTIDSDQLSTQNTFTVNEDGDVLNKFFEDDHVRIYLPNGDEIVANVDSVDPANKEITFKASVIGGLADKVRIVRMYNTVATGGEFLNSITLDPTKYFESYYQWFGGRVSFTLDELNKSYATEKGVKDFVDAKFQALYQDLFMQVGNAFWYGLNIPEVTSSQNAQTMGVLTGIYGQVQVNGLTLIHDLASKTTGIAKVKALIEIFMDAQTKQLDGGDNTLMVAGNHKFWNALSKLNPDWNTLMGVVPTVDKNVDINFEVKVVNTIFGRIEFYADFFLNYYYPNKSFGVVMPKNMMAIHMRENESVTVVNDAGVPVLERVQPGFKVVDLAPRMIGYVGVGSTLEVYSHHAHIIAGLGTGAYRIIENLN